MMINSKNLAMMLVGFAAIISVGVFSATNTAEASQEEVPGMMGHIEMTLRDSDGNIKEYIQTDNFVTDTGRNCLSENSFGVNSNCAATFFTFIGLGTNTSASGEDVGTPLASGCVRSDASDSDTGDVATSAGTSVETITLTVVFGGASSGAGGIANAACEATITEAGLFNNESGATGELFAYQTFSAIAVGNFDTLTVTWTVTIT